MKKTNYVQMMKGNWLKQAGSFFIPASNKEESA